MDRAASLPAGQQSPQGYLPARALRAVVLRDKYSGASNLHLIQPHPRDRKSFVKTNMAAVCCSDLVEDIKRPLLLFRLSRGHKDSCRGALLLRNRAPPPEERVLAASFTDYMAPQDAPATMRITKSIAAPV